MAYMGMDAIVALIRVAQLTMDRYLACQPAMRFCIQSTRY